MICPLQKQTATEKIIHPEYLYHHLQRVDILKAFVKGVRGYFSYYLRRFSLCFCLNNAFQPVLRSQTATMVKKHFDFIICFALLNHKNSIRFVFLRMVILVGSVLFTIFVIRYSSLNEKSPTRKGLTTKFRQRTSENLFSLSGDTIFLLFPFSL